MVDQTFEERVPMLKTVKEIRAGTFSVSIESPACGRDEYSLRFTNGNQIKWIYSKDIKALEGVAAQLAIRYLLNELDQCPSI